MSDNEFKGISECIEDGCWYDATPREDRCYFHHKIHTGLMDSRTEVEPVNPFWRLLNEWETGWRALIPRESSL